MINVHLIASRGNVQENVESLRRIIDIVKQEKHEIARDWVNSAYEKYEKKQTGALDWPEIYRLNLETIAKADIIIAETTYNSFGVGYQVAVAVQQKKPTLLLRHDDAKVDAFATGIVDPWVKSVSYNAENLDTIIRSFLEENDITTKDMRFNFFIDRPIYNYLRWSAFKTGKTKAEILRELVQKEIDNKE